ncbi:MAG: DUF6132 family protein [Melioribacteraceae bacterium]|nr:DUF6132 family protein [Melioribacteraceae bacterium]
MKIGYKQIVPVILGAVLGYAYYYFIGCNSGSCPITSSPYVSTIYGAVIGLVFAIPSKKKNEKTENN